MNYSCREVYQTFLQSHSKKEGHSLKTFIFLSIEHFVGKYVSPTFVMPHRGMTSLASVGLDEKPWLSASLAWLNTLPDSGSQKKQRVETRHAGRTSGQGLLEEKERGLEGERGNSRRGFPSGDDA